LSIFFIFSIAAMNPLWLLPAGIGKQLGSVQSG
jgi:hypothetical protein